MSLLKWLLAAATALAAQARVPVYVMLPLDTISSSLTINNPDKLRNQLSQLKSGNVEGVMADCWWGLVEKQEKVYAFDVYRQLTQMVQDAGLKMEYVLSFHRCGKLSFCTCGLLTL